MFKCDSKKKLIQVRHLIKSNCLNKKFLSADMYEVYIRSLKRSNMSIIHHYVLIQKWWSNSVVYFSHLKCLFLR